MSDNEFLQYCGFADPLSPEARTFLAKVDQSKRDVVESMAAFEQEYALYQAGLGPKPEGVIMCGDDEINHGGENDNDEA